MLGFLPDELLTTPSFRFYQEQLPNDGDIVFKARVMALRWLHGSDMLRSSGIFSRFVAIGISILLNVRHLL